MEATMEATMIPLTKDVADLVGDWAERVDNRSLLSEKFALPKSWGQPRTGKLGQAGRWNILRIVTRRPDLRRSGARRLRNEARGRNARHDIAERRALLRVHGGGLREHGVHALACRARRVPGRGGFGPVAGTERQQRGHEQGVGAVVRAASSSPQERPPA